MMNHAATAVSEFDAYAEAYQAELSHPCRRFVDAKDNYFIDLKCTLLHKLLIELGQCSQELTVADIGCGIGDFEQRLAHDFKHLFALDLSWKMLQRAQQLVQSRRGGLKSGGFICGDSLTLPLADASVDLVFASCLLHHITFVDPAVVIGELRRICRPGGWIICFEHNPLNPITQLVVRTTPLDKTAKLISSWGLQSAFRQAGLRQIFCRYLLFGPKAVDRRLAQLAPLLQKVPLGAQYLVAGQK